MEMLHFSTVYVGRTMKISNEIKSESYSLFFFSHIHNFQLLIMLSCNIDRWVRYHNILIMCITRVVKKNQGD